VVGSGDVSQPLDLDVTVFMLAKLVNILVLLSATGVLVLLSCSNMYGSKQTYVSF
jgi:hypothetical protein